jgi:ribokinase
LSLPKQRLKVKDSNQADRVFASLGQPASTGSEPAMESLSPRIFALGDIAWDLLLQPEEPLVFGSDVPGKAEFTPGGSAANFAVWAARLEAEVLLQGKIGDDSLGKMMEEYLVRKKVGLHLQIVTGTRTTRIGVVVSLLGERAFVMDKPTSLAFNLQDFDPTCLDGRDLFFFTGYSLFTSSSLPFIQRILEEARVRKVPIAFDPASFHLIEGYGPQELLERIGPVDFLLLNEEEASKLTLTDTKALLRNGRTVVLKQGLRGSTAFSALCEWHVPSPPAPVLDSTGAGDAFDAAFLVEFLRSGDIPFSLRKANRLGAYVVSHYGSQPEGDWAQILNAVDN